MRVRQPYRLGYYTVKRYPLKDKPVKLTYMKKLMREAGYQAVRKVEVIDFQKPYYDGGKVIYFGADLKDRIYRFEEEQKKNSYDFKLDESLIRSRSRMFEYALCNQFEYFVTLTIDAEKHDRYDLSAYKKSLGQFLNNYKKRKATKIKYVLVPEFHEDGAVHMHGLIAGIPAEDLQKNEYGYLDWPPYSKRFGYFSCSPIRDYESCAKYVTKYITKELKNMPKGKQILLCSKGLKTAEIIDKGYDTGYNTDNPDYENEYIKITWIDDNELPQNSYFV